MVISSWIEMIRIQDTYPQYQVHRLSKINLSKLINELSKNNLVADEVHEKEETLENYYMNLIGGGKND